MYDWFVSSPSGCETMPTMGRGSWCVRRTSATSTPSACAFQSTRRHHHKTRIDLCFAFIAFLSKQAAHRCRWRVAQAQNLPGNSPRKSKKREKKLRGGGKQGREGWPWNEREMDDPSVARTRDKMLPLHEQRHQGTLFKPLQDILDVPLLVHGDHWSHSST